MSVLAFALFATSALAAFVAWRIRRAATVPGSGAFYCLMLAVGAWCATSGFHGVVDSLDAKLLWAKIQYGAIASVPPLWFLFAAEYGDVTWAAQYRAKAALWIVPVLTMLAAWTNSWHGALWPSVTLDAAGVAVYGHGWWFWVAAAYNYVLVLVGAALFIRALRNTPPPFRSQWMALIAAALVPLAGNAAYISGLTVPGLDPTPIAFTVSGLLFIRALHRDRLFELIPVARDTVIEGLSDAVIVLDASRRVLDMNAAARAIAGHPAHWAGKPVGSLIPVLRDVSLDVVSDWSTTLTYERRGDVRFFDVRVIRVRTRRGRAAASVMVLRDISEQLKAEAERAALAARVQEQQKRESLSVLAGGLAHDFNNLLTGIVGNADLLSLHIPPSSDMGHSVGAILLGAQRAADLVDKMLAYAGERHGSIERVDLHALVGDMVDLMRASAARHCTLDYEGQSAVLEADATQIRQVVMNLIINAADVVNERGRIVVKVGIEHLNGQQLGAVECADDAVPADYGFVEVEDNGPGMDSATIARIFQPFFTTKPTGHGLGLAAVQGIVHGHRGALRVRSAVGTGSTFRVWFPLAPAIPEGAPPPPQSAQSRTSAPLRTR
ncbi:MAG: PAS domain-containing protein [Acidimicrobiia bacterium]|nr:PAS domain-containing protein [Acidimicrobiia bacterium]